MVRVFVCLAAFLTSTSVFADTVFVSARTSTQAGLYTFDVGTGLTFVGETPVAMVDIAYHSGTLYGVSSTDLYTINPATGNSTLIGSLGASLSALTFGPNGTLYGAGHSQFFTVNTATGAATQVGGTTNYVTFGDMAFLNGTLYMSTRTPPPSNPCGGSIFVVDASTGSGATPPFVQATPPDINGLAASNGLLYGFANDSRCNPPDVGNSIVQIDPVTGAVTRVGSASRSITLLGATTIPSPVPEPGTMAMLAVGLAGMAAIRQARLRGMPRQEKWL